MYKRSYGYIAQAQRTEPQNRRAFCTVFKFSIQILQSFFFLLLFYRFVFHYTFMFFKHLRWHFFPFSGNFYRKHTTHLHTRSHTYTTHTSQLLGRHIRRIQFCRFYRCSPFNGTYAYYFIYFFTVISLHVSLTSRLYCNIQHCPTLPDPKCSVPLSALPNGVLASLTAAAHTQ